MAPASANAAPIRAERPSGGAGNRDARGQPLSPVVRRLLSENGLAAGGAQRGDVVLLGRACASMDQVPDYAEGGSRFRELAWTAGFGLAFTALALAVLGPTPFVAFLGEHLPRLGNGAAFAFHEIWPEAASLLINDNQGPYGLVLKLGLLGVPGMNEAMAAWVGRVFSLAVLGLAFLWGRRRFAGFESAADTPARLAAAVGWLGLLGLASLASPGAWGDYVPVTAVWLLTLLAVPMTESRRTAWLLAPVWLFQATLLGTMPIGEWAPPMPMAVVAGLGAVMLIGLFGWAVLGRPARSQARSTLLEEVPVEVSPVRRAA